jgi:5-methyltetrahydropteroyltriglutamate--homocysteine methyltransferase
LTEFLLALSGVHARSEAMIRATQDWERKRIDSRTLAKAFTEDSKSLLALQSKVGADHVSDGQMGPAWQDFLRPITDGFGGIRKGPLFRWFNTNTFYYVPIIFGELTSDGETIWKSLERRFVKDDRTFKVILPDPLTFCELAEDRYYGNFEKLLFAYSEALNEELRSLEAHGVGYVQLSSPSLVARFRKQPLSNGALQQLGEGVRSALRGVSLRSGFHTCFGDASPYLPLLYDVIPTDDIGFDFTQMDPSSLTRAKKGLIAGIVDSRSTWQEDVVELKREVEGIVDRTGSPSVILAPSSDLRYIPRVYADKKVAKLGELKMRLRGVAD